MPSPSGLARVPKVSVVITTRNRRDFLKQAIESVLRARSDRYELELIVVNDGSTDGTDTLLEQYPVVVVHTAGVGMARARNLGLDAASGDFVTLLDDDDVWLPTNVLTQLDEFERRPHLAVVHAQAQIADFELRPVGAAFPVGPLSSGMIFESLLGYMPQVATVLTRMSAAREAGGMDVSLAGDTDWDWLLRIAKRHEVGRCETPVMLFRQRSEFDEELGWRRFPATLRVFRRHVRSLPLWRRVLLWRVLWRHRGQWASDFFNAAKSHDGGGRRRRALRCFIYAVRVSPPHTFKMLFSSLFSRRIGAST